MFVDHLYIFWKLPINVLYPLFLLVCHLFLLIIIIIIVHIKDISLLFVVCDANIFSRLVSSSAL